MSHNSLRRGTDPYADGDATRLLLAPTVKVEFNRFDWEWQGGGQTGFTRYATVLQHCYLKSVYGVMQKLIENPAGFRISIRSVPLATLLIPDMTPAGTVLEAQIPALPTALLAPLEVIEIYQSLKSSPGQKGQATFVFLLEPVI